MSDEKETSNNKLDIDGDGIVSDSERDMYTTRVNTKRRMAIIAMSSMIILTILLFTPWVGVERVKAIGDLIGMFYIAMAGIVGTYMGAEAWMSVNRK